MKALIINNLFPPYERGGAEKVALKQAEDMAKAGHQVILVSTKPTGSSPSSNLRGIPIQHLNSRYLSLGGWPLFLRPFWHLANIFSFRKLWQLKKILTSEKPDLVITHNLMGIGFLAPLAFKRLNIKQEHWLHDIQLLHPSGLMIAGREDKVNQLGARLYQALTRHLFISPDKVISPSRWLLEEHLKRGFFLQSQTEVVSRPIVPPLTTEPKSGPIKKILFVGQLEAHKGADLLIRAFLKIKRPDLSLTIVGAGRELNQLTKLAAQSDQIKFLGRLPATEVQKIMASSDLLVVPSLCYENSPTVIHEAQALGLRVLAADIGGIPEILTQKDRLFRAGNENDLGTKMAELTQTSA